MAAPADSFRVLQAEERRRVAFVGLLVVDHRSAGMVTIASDKQAVAALAGVEVTKKCLLPDPMRTAPALVTVEATVRFDCRGTWMWTLLPVNAIGGYVSGIELLVVGSR